MGKNKLRKFAEMAQNPLVLQYPFSRLQAEGKETFPMRGRWHDFFKNPNPIVLELGCGKGEYAVGLARLFPDKNFVGIDIKGARMHAGATEALKEGMGNIAFLRTQIELLESFFAPGEVDEIWITFPDPQMKKASKRLTGTRFVELYRKIMRPDGTVHLKTDSPFLYAYTKEMTRLNKLALKADTADLYASESNDAILGIKTHYEKQWIARGLSIKYLAFDISGNETLAEPEDNFERDTYRSYSRGKIQSSESNLR